MNSKQNLHTHTTYADGRNRPEELVREAISRGFSGLGFSEHTYMPFSSYPYQMTVEKMPKYRAEILRLKEQCRGKLDIFCGLEWEFYSDVPAEGYDYLIGSVHYLSVNGSLYGFDHDLEKTRAYIRDHFGGDAMKFAKAYYETVSRLPERGKFDILGHFDLLTKTNEQGRFLDTTDPAYLAMGFEAIHALRGKIPLFEVNTGAMARGYRTTPYPQPEFLKEFYACVTLSGALPFMYLVSKVLHRPLNRLGSVMGINGVSALAFLGSSVTNATTFGMADRMDNKGLVLNSAFAVSASFVFGSHLAFTMAYDGTYVLPMVVGKLISGLCAVALALLLYRDDSQ